MIDRKPVRLDLLLACVGLALAAGVVRAAEHPSLIRADSEACVTCHEDLLGSRVTHEPAKEDCTACHEVAIDDAGTRISLMEAEPALCVMCHDDLSPAVEGALASPHYPVSDSCLNCHGPHGSDQDRLLNAPVAETCSTCHDLAELAGPHGGQLTESSNCVKCHDPHGSVHAGMLQAANQHRPFQDGSCNGCHRAPFGDRIRLRSRGEKLCTACHVDLRPPSDGGGSFHAALRGEKGRAGCLSCHDPHMSGQGRLLIRPRAELCAGCHPAIVEAAAAETGHYAAADDCGNCHLPHFADEARLLSSPAQELCTGCHDISDDDLVGKHLGASLEQVRCLDCHTPHGSGHRKLLAENLHPPVEDGCDTCHEGSARSLLEDGESALCLTCHEDPSQPEPPHAVPHPAMEVARCADCHNPHASPQPKLVKAPGGRVCLECHSDQEPADGEVAHGAIDLLGCQACHEPHGGARPKLLRLEGDALCRSCHDPRAIKAPADGRPVMLQGRFPLPEAELHVVASLRLSPDGTEGHPLANHRVAGAPTEEELKRTEVVFEGVLGCLTCHDPHKGRSNLILRWNAASAMEACKQCHPK